MLRATIAILIVLGVLAALLRGYDTARFMARARTGPAADPGALTDFDRRNIEGLTGALGIEKSSARYRDLEVETAAYGTRFKSYPLMTFMHVGPGSLILILGALQFSARIRNRYRRFHRWSGRTILVAALAVGVSAFFFGLLMPYGGLGESLAIMSFGSLFLFTAARAFLAIRRGDVVHHREWMIRMYCLALSISTIRIFNLLLLAIGRTSVRDTFVISLWAGWILTLILGELWIRHTRRQTVVMKGAPNQANDRHMATWAS